MNGCPIRCSSGRLRSTAARTAAGVTAVTPTRRGGVEGAGNVGRNPLSVGCVSAPGPEPPTPSACAQGKHLRRRVSAGIVEASAPCESSIRNTPTLPTRTASRSGDGSPDVAGDGLAPRSSSSCTAGSAPTMPAAMTSAVRRSSVRASTLTPASSTIRILSVSGRAHINAVAPATFDAPASAPIATSFFIRSASP